MMKETKAVSLPWKHILVDALLTIGIPNGLLLWNRYYARPFSQAGFFCTDNSIRLPYKPETVTMGLLWIYKNFTPAVVVLLVELCCLLKDKDEICSHYEQNRPFPQRLAIRFFYYFRCHYLAMGLHFAIFTMTRVTIGKMRPNYLDRCRPNIGYPVCNTTEYITNYVCTGAWTFDQMERLRSSFFSGHASISACVSTFLTLYLHHRLSHRSATFTVVPWLQLGITALSLFISYTRIVDHVHHPVDVFVGFYVGTIATCLTWIFVAKFNKEPKKVD